MGIKGLETFVDDEFYSKPERKNEIFAEKCLSELKFVLDGNQLAHKLTHDLESNLYGGDYNFLYEKVVKFLEKLEPFIEVVIFDGSKESCAKAHKRLEDRMKKISDKNDLSLYFTHLRGITPLFTHMIIFKVLSELSIKYFMSSGRADLAIAMYANGENKTGQKFTILSRNSYFYVYKLSSDQAGYVSWRHVKHLLDEPDSINAQTKVDVFYLNRMLDFIHYKHWKTWFYFCILLGDNDQALERNKRFFYRFKLQPNDVLHLLINIGLEEHTWQSNDFHLIKTYFINDKTNENKTSQIEEMRQLFELNNKMVSYSFINSIKLNKEMSCLVDSLEEINEFDRFISTLKHLKANYIPCLIEDTCKATVFRKTQSLDLFQVIYSVLNMQQQQDSNNDRIEFIDEYFRNEFGAIEHKIVSLTQDNENKVLKYLLTRNQMNKNEDISQDFLSILLYALKLWLELSREDLITNHFVQSILKSFCLIQLGSSANLFKIAKSGKQFGRFLHYFDRKEFDQVFYMKNELECVHKLNEFQALYYTMGIVHKLFDLTCLKYILPHHFLNAKFCVKYMCDEEFRHTFNTDESLLHSIEYKKLLDKLYQNLKEIS
jgi:hypothetical protein